MRVGVRVWVLVLVLVLLMVRVRVMTCESKIIYSACRGERISQIASPPLSTSEIGISDEISNEISNEISDEISREISTHGAGGCRCWQPHDAAGERLERWREGG